MISMTPLQSWGTIFLIFLATWAIIQIVRELEDRASAKLATRETATETEEATEPTQLPTLTVVPKRDEPELYDHQVHGL